MKEYNETEAAIMMARDGIIMLDGDGCRTKWGANELGYFGYISGRNDKHIQDDTFGYCVVKFKGPYTIWQGQKEIKKTSTSQVKLKGTAVINYESEEI